MLCPQVSIAEKSFSDGEVGREEERGGRAKCTESNYQRAGSLARERGHFFYKDLLEGN